MDLRLEVVVLPVSDVDRAKDFYRALGWREDADLATGPDFRVVQLTPPGSACSVIFGTGLTAAAPGSAEGLQLVADDIDATRAELAGRGAPVSEVFHDVGGIFHHAGTAARVPGRVAPAPTTYDSASVLAEALRRAAAAHGKHEEQTGQPDPNWPDWYATYMVDEQTGPTAGS
jgi:catechol 2,3-dioxygenase-like lactoylglutathione lyase family enzyme